MDRRELLDRAARDEDKRLLLGRVWDKWEQCRLRSIPTATDFLSPQEQAAAQRLLGALGVHDGYVFFGGYDGAERQRLFFLPDWAEEPDAGAVAAVAAAWYGGERLTHRDFLGSLMGLGLTRGTIGDILVTDTRCQVLALPKTADFLLSEWESAGRVKLKTAPLPLEELEIPAQACRELRDTVSSLRLDNVLAAGFSLSRGRAAEAVEKGAVQVNWTVCQKPDKPVAAGDTITCRGLGKCVLDSVGSPTKRDGSPWSSGALYKGEFVWIRRRSTVSTSWPIRPRPRASPKRSRRSGRCCGRSIWTQSWETSGGSWTIPIS